DRADRREHGARPSARGGAAPRERAQAGGVPELAHLPQGRVPEARHGRRARGPLAVREAPPRSRAEARALVAARRRPREGEVRGAARVPRSRRQPLIRPSFFSSSAAFAVSSLTNGPTFSGFVVWLRPAQTSLSCSRL